MRRLIILPALIFGFVLVSIISAKDRAKRLRDQSLDGVAQDNWDSEGGTPLPDAVDTPISLRY